MVTFQAWGRFCVLTLLFILSLASIRSAQAEQPYTREQIVDHLNSVYENGAIPVRRRIDPVKIITYGLPKEDEPLFQFAIDVVSTYTDLKIERVQESADAHVVIDFRKNVPFSIMTSQLKDYFIGNAGSEEALIHRLNEDNALGRNLYPFHTLTKSGDYLAQSFMVAETRDFHRGHSVPAFFYYQQIMFAVMTGGGTSNVIVPSAANWTTEDLEFTKRPRIDGFHLYVLYHSEGWDHLTYDEAINRLADSFLLF